MPCATPGSPGRLWDFGLALGSPAFFGAVVVALAMWAIARRSWPALVACATVPGAVLIVEQILKPLVDRRYALAARSTTRRAPRPASRPGPR